MSPNAAVILALGGALFIPLVAAIVVFVRFVITLNRKASKMALDFTGIQSSLSTLTVTVNDVSSTVSTLQASSDSAADQATLDGMTSSLNGLNSTLSNLVTAPSTVSTTEGQQ